MVQVVMEKVATQIRNRVTIPVRTATRPIPQIRMDRVVDSTEALAGPNQRSNRVSRRLSCVCRSGIVGFPIFELRVVFGEHAIVPLLKHVHHFSDVQRILDAIPELRGGDKLELRIAAEGLRAAQLLAKNASSTKLFKKYPMAFALTPPTQPNKVQYLRPRRR